MEYSLKAGSVLAPMASLGTKNKTLISQSVLKYALELSYLSYRLNALPLMQKDFFDISIYDRYDFLNLEDIKNNKTNTPSVFRQLTSLVLGKSNKLSRLMIAASQHEDSIIISIAIAGSSSNLNDWYSNFDMQVKNSYHRGFYESASNILDLFEQINLNKCANLLGLKSLNMKQAIEMCKLPSSPIKLFICGHSKGGALMQVIVARLINDYFVYSKNILGIGFAPPRVVNTSFLYKPSSYPIINIINSDDIVCKMGSLMHLGINCEYQADKGLISSSYALPKDPEKLRLVETYFSIWNKIKNIEDSLSLLYAFYNRAKLSADSEIKEIMSSKANFALDFIPTSALSNSIIEKRKQKIANLHQAILGHPIKEERINYFYRLLERNFKDYSLKQIVLGYMATFSICHKLSSSGKKIGVYEYIIKNSPKISRVYSYSRNARLLNQSSKIAFTQKHNTKNKRLKTSGR